MRLRQLFLSAQITDYTFDVDSGDLYYYVYDDGLYKIKSEGSEKQKIYDMVEGETNVCQITYLNGNIYLSNDMFFAFYGVEPRESYINVISSQGELKDKIFLISRRYIL